MRSRQFTIDVGPTGSGVFPEQAAGWVRSANAAEQRTASRGKQPIAAVPMFFPILAVTATTIDVAGDLTGLDLGEGWYFILPPVGIDRATGATDTAPCAIPTRYLAFGYCYVTPTAGVYIAEHETLATGIHGRQPADNFAGEYYAWHRRYDPVQGRWTTPDPAASPWWNLMDYSAHRSDPTGLAANDHSARMKSDSASVGAHAAERLKEDPSLKKAMEELAKGGTECDPPCECKVWLIKATFAKYRLAQIVHGPKSASVVIGNPGENKAGKVVRIASTTVTWDATYQYDVGINWTLTCKTSAPPDCAKKWVKNGKFSTTVDLVHKMSETHQKEIAANATAAADRKVVENLIKKYSTNKDTTERVGQSANREGLPSEREVEVK